MQCAPASVDRLHHQQLSTPKAKQMIRNAWLLVALLTLAACDRDKREFRPAPVNENAPQQLRVFALQAGVSSPQMADARRHAYEGHAFQIAEGQRLFQWFNCVGCHAHGGGDSGRC